MHQPINAVANIDKSTEVAHRSHNSFQRFPDLQRFEHLRACICSQPFNHSPPRKHEFSRCRDNLGHEAFQSLADEFSKIFHAPWADEARWHEAPQAPDLAFEATLIRTRDTSLNDHARLDL